MLCILLHLDDVGATRQVVRHVGRAQVVVVDVALPDAHRTH
jgi:hypothetical protein